MTSTSCVLFRTCSTELTVLTKQQESVRRVKLYVNLSPIHNDWRKNVNLHERIRKSSEDIQALITQPRSTVASVQTMSRREVVLMIIVVPATTHTKRALFSEMTSQKRMKAKRRRRRRRGSHPARRRRVMTQTMMIQMRVKRKRSPRRFHERRNRPKDLISLRRRVRRGNNRRELHHLHQLHNHRQGSQICLINQLKLLHLLHRILVWDCLTTQLQCHRSHNLLPLRICLTMCNSLVNQHSHNSSQLVSASL